MPSISILGTGWLGNALAHYLIKFHKDVSVSQHRQILNSESITKISWAYPNPLPSELQKDIIVIAMPPSILIDEQVFSEFLAKSNIGSKIIYCSSTGIYGSMQGVCTEDLQINVQNERIKRLLDLENVVRKHSDRNCILRLAGLVGPSRDPRKFFEKSGTIPDDLQAINYVHRFDVMNFIKCVIESDAVGIYNVCSTEHPSKRNFYKSLAEGSSEYIEEASDEQRIVSSKKGIDQLSFRYEIPNILHHYLQLR